MPDVYYCCHGCGSIHEVEAIRRNLHVAGRPVGDTGLPRHLPLGWLERRRAAALLVRGLWRGRAARSSMTARMPVASAPHRSFPGGGKGPAPAGDHDDALGRQDGPGPADGDRGSAVLAGHLQLAQRPARGLPVRDFVP
jgi:hypothetical protein